MCITNSLLLLTTVGRKLYLGGGGLGIAKKIFSRPQIFLGYI